MKKTLVALAALSAIGAFAQSSVSIVGALDVGIKGVSAPTTTASGNSNSQTAINHGNTATNSLKFIGTEDMGGGLKANFLLEVNPTPSSSSNTNASVNGNASYAGTPFNGEQYVSLSSNMGELKIGVPNAGAFVTTGMMTPLGTGMASGYSTSFGRLGGQTSTTAVAGFPTLSSDINGTAGARIVRSERSVQYVTPKFSGFSALVDYAFGNNSTPAVTTGSNVNTPKYVGATLMYGNGPLNVAYAYANISIDSFGVYGANVVTQLGAPALYAANDVTVNTLAANYTFGAATVYGGYTTSKQNNTATATVDDSSWNIAGKYALNANIDLLANYLVRSSNVANVNNAKVYGGGADYKLSKRTNLYARYELIDINTDGKVGTAGSVTNAFALGVKHTF